MLIVSGKICEGREKKITTNSPLLFILFKIWLKINAYQPSVKKVRRRCLLDFRMATDVAIFDICNDPGATAFFQLHRRGCTIATSNLHAISYYIIYLRNN